MVVEASKSVRPQRTGRSSSNFNSKMKTKTQRKTIAVKLSSEHKKEIRTWSMRKKL